MTTPGTPEPSTPPMQSSSTTAGDGPKTPPEHLRNVIEIWKATVEVQKHFNDLELRIRNYAITLLTTVLGVTAFALKERVGLDVGGWHTSLASGVLFAGTLAWIAFYLMDRFWYHNLLLGSVKHGLSIEQRYAAELPEIGLAGSIGAASPTKVLGMKLHSSHKMNLFYGFIAAGLISLVLLFHFTAPPP